MSRLPMLAQPLRGPRARVRDSAERDIPEVLIAYEEDRTMHLRLIQDRPPSGAELGRLAESESVDRAAGSRAALSITAVDEDLCLGQVSVGSLDWDHGRANVAIWVSPQVRRQGLGSDALELVGDWLLGGCGLARVQFLCEPENVPALRAAERARFVAEGTLYGYLRRRESRVDVCVLARVAE